MNKIENKGILNSMIDRMPLISKKNMNYYFNCIIDLLVQRFIRGEMTIIDGFGVLYIYAYPMKGIYDVHKRFYDRNTKYIARRIVFQPHRSFNRLLASSDKDFLGHEIKKKKVIKKSSLTC